jgi:hypothetical protein
MLWTCYVYVEHILVQNLCRLYIFVLFFKLSAKKKCLNCNDFGSLVCIMNVASAMNAQIPLRMCTVFVILKIWGMSRLYTYMN